MWNCVMPLTARKWHWVRINQWTWLIFQDLDQNWTGHINHYHWLDIGNMVTKVLLVMVFDHKKLASSLNPLLKWLHCFKRYISRMEEDKSVLIMEFKLEIWLWNYFGGRVQPLITCIGIQAGLTGDGASMFRKTYIRNCMEGSMIIMELTLEMWWWKTIVGDGISLWPLTTTGLDCQLLGEGVWICKKTVYIRFGLDIFCDCRHWHSPVLWKKNVAFEMCTFNVLKWFILILVLDPDSVIL